jgi:hypothetical protein
MYLLGCFRRLLVVILVVGGAAAVGCGDGRPTRVPVAGIVTIDGEPLKMGMIKFAPAGQRPAIGAIDGEGRFTLTTYEKGDGVITGTHRVSVTAVEPITERSNRWHAPKKYAESDSSGLEVTIDGPKDDLNIELTWDGGKQFVENF